MPVRFYVVILCSSSTVHRLPGYDRRQQPLPEERRRLILLRRPIALHRLQHCHGVRGSGAKDLRKGSVLLRPRRLRVLVILQKEHIGRSMTL